MPSFICKVRTPQGQIIKVKLTEEDKMACLKKLKRNGMTPIEVKQSLIVPPKVSRKISASIAAKKREEKIVKLDKDVVKTISITSIKEFSEELLFLRQAKFTNQHALKTIINKTQNQNLKDILKEILKNIEKNTYMYKTMEKYPQIFPIIYVNLIKNGELTGAFDEGLKNAISYLENEEKLADVLQNKIFPDILLIFVTILIMFLSIVLGIPIIENLLDNVNIKLDFPVITKIIIAICNLIVNKWYIFVILIAIAFLGFFINLKSSKGKFKFDEFKYKNKIFGKLLYLLDFSRLFRCLTINLKNKMRLQDSLEVCKSVEKNTYMLNKIEKAINEIFRSKKWIDVFEEDKILDPIVIEMIVASSKEKTFEITSKTIEYLEYQIDKELEKVVLRLTEVSYIILGLLFLIYIVAVLMPCISTYLSSFLVF